MSQTFLSKAKSAVKAATPYNNAIVAYDELKETLRKFLEGYTPEKQADPLRKNHTLPQRAHNLIPRINPKIDIVLKGLTDSEKDQERKRKLLELLEPVQQLSAEHEKESQEQMAILRAAAPLAAKAEAEAAMKKNELGQKLRNQYERVTGQKALGSFAPSATSKLTGLAAAYAMPQPPTGSASGTGVSGGRRKTRRSKKSRKQKKTRGRKH